jgi:predicted transposase YbfD/YdcC
MQEVLTLEESFGKIEDPRVERTKRHKLIDIIIIAICAVICGAEGWGEMEQFGREKQEWLETFLELPNGIPSHDTLNRVFARINPEEFEHSFFEWVSALTGTIHGVIAIDGKTVRRSHEKASGKKALHLVSAWATENRLVLAQVATEKKSNEITAIPKLLHMLDLSGCIVTIDAMGTQKPIAKQIIEQNGDYALALKKNHGLLYHKVETLFAQASQENFEGVPHQQIQVTNKGHGRQEDRHYWIIQDQEIIDSLDEHGDWQGFQSIGMVQSQRRIGQKVTTQVRYYLLSIQGNAATFAHAVRSHWGIENSLHWVLDVAFHEDLSRTRTGHSAHNFALLRHIALNVLRQEHSASGGIHAKRLKAALSTPYLEKLLSNIYAPPL